MKNNTTKEIRDTLPMTREEYLARVVQFAEYCAVHKIFSKPKAKFSKMEWIEKER